MRGMSDGTNRVGRARRPATLKTAGTTLGWVMRQTTILVAAIVVGAVPATARAQQPAPTAAPLVFDGVTVVDVEHGKLLPKQRVVIVGSHIQAVDAVDRIKLPSGARVVDARGKYLIPGLWDMHTHMHRIDIGPLMLITHGVTGVRDVGSYPPLAQWQQWKREIAAGTRIGPRLLVSGRAMSEAGSSDTQVTQGNHLGDWGMSVPRTLLPQVVDSMKAAGADMIKTYFFSREGYFALAAKARRVGLPFGGHLPKGEAGSELKGMVTPLEASDSGATFLDHPSEHPCRVDDPSIGRSKVGGLHYLDGTECADAVARFRRNQSWVVLGPFFEGNKSDMVMRLHSDSVPMLMGTDMLDRPEEYWFKTGFLTPGITLHNGLSALVAHGFTPLEALRTATLNPALALRATDSLGTVAAGKLADLVLLDADPLANIKHTTKIRAVVANGRYFDRAALDRVVTKSKAKIAEAQAKAQQQP